MGAGSLADGLVLTVASCASSPVGSLLSVVDVAQLKLAMEQTTPEAIAEATSAFARSSADAANRLPLHSRAHATNTIGWAAAQCRTAADDRLQSSLTRVPVSLALGTGIHGDGGVSMGDSIGNLRGAHGGARSVSERCSDLCATDAKCEGTPSDDDSAAHVPAPKRGRLVAASLESSLGIDITARVAANGTSSCIRVPDSLPLGTGILDHGGDSIGDSIGNSRGTHGGARGVSKQYSDLYATDAKSEGTLSDDDYDSVTVVSALKRRRLVAASVESSLGIDMTAQVFSKSFRTAVTNS